MTIQPKQLTLSPNFTLWEAMRSQTADRNGINNTIPQILMPNVLRMAKLMEQVRTALNNKPIRVSSWYRSLQLNAAIGGSSRSQHMLGCAVDFDCDSYGTPADICRRIILLPQIQFDQLILEHSWVHISVPNTPDDKPKMQVLSLLNSKGYAQGLTNKFGRPI
jgi:zinc D-Ala-D-Ala carboxypeptidase